MPGRPRYTGKREQHLHKTLFYCPSIDMTVTYRDMKYCRSDASMPGNPHRNAGMSQAGASGPLQVWQR